MDKSLTVVNDCEFFRDLTFVLENDGTKRAVANACTKNMRVVGCQEQKCQYKTVWQDLMKSGCCLRGIKGYVQRNEDELGRHGKYIGQFIEKFDREVNAYKDFLTNCTVNCYYSKKTGRLMFFAFGKDVYDLDECTCERKPFLYVIDELNGVLAECEDIRKTCMTNCPQCGEYLNPVGVELYEENYRLRRFGEKMYNNAKRYLKNIRKLQERIKCLSVR